MELVQCYKQRTYDEELVWLRKTGGTFCLLNFLGIDNVGKKLKVNFETGLTGVDFQERTGQFGNNYRDPIKAKHFCKIFGETLDDFMLKLLIVCASFSITFDMILSTEEERSHGR